MNRFYFFLWLCVIPVASAEAQDSTIQYQAPHLILKIAPLSVLIDPDATIQAGLEIRTGRRNSVQAEIGVGHKGLSVISDEKKNFADWSLWRVRSEWRHYTNRFRTNNRKNVHIRSGFPLGNYLAIEGFAKQITGTKNLRMNNGTSNELTTQQAIDRFVWGSHVKWGRQIAIPSESVTSLSRVLIDVYVGIGLRFGTTQTTPDVQSCGCGLGVNRFQQGRAVQPSLAAGLKIGFGL